MFEGLRAGAKVAGVAGTEEGKEAVALRFHGLPAHTQHPGVHP